MPSVQIIHPALLCLISGNSKRYDGRGSHDLRILSGGCNARRAAERTCAGNLLGIVKSLSAAVRTFNKLLYLSPVDTGALYGGVEVELLNDRCRIGLRKLG